MAKDKKDKGEMKSQIVAFKVDEDLAEFLDKLPNKSEFIRRAILAQFSLNCPLCTGSGVVARGVHDHFCEVISEHSVRPCEKCKTPVSFPLSPDGVVAADKLRIEQFLKGGPLYCAKCFPSVPPCDDCGWHVMMEKVAEHFKKVHSHS
ncbi:MAG: hypothetical protein L0241_15485 [Planctomycetia bacterium]|nr:hypothetical protein [Planctomycetia bacterium]